MGGDEVKVLGSWCSPFSSRVELVLKLKGIPYQLLEQDVVNKSPQLLQLNPIHKKIPVFLHNGKPICESQIIIEYIDETWKHNPILPQHPHDKAIARFWANLVDTKFAEAFRKVMLSTNEEEKLEEANKLVEVLQVVEGELKVKGKKFFGGEIFGYVDIVLCWLSIWIAALHQIACVQIYDSQNFPHLAKWMEHILQVPVIQQTLPSQDKVLDFFTQVRSFFVPSASQAQK